MDNAQLRKHCNEINSRFVAVQSKSNTLFLKERVTILEIFESESNQQTADDKFNRVDIKACNSTPRL